MQLTWLKRETPIFLIRKGQGGKWDKILTTSGELCSFLHICLVPFSMLNDTGNGGIHV